MTTRLQISNCSKQDTQNLEEYIRHLYTYIKNKLNFSVEPIVKLIDDKQNSKNPLGSTAHYEPSTKTISVFITDRHIKDILRSIAHELIHHEQNCNNMISADSDMSEGYAQKNKQLRNLEEDAFSRGNLLFRDWEHSLKRKKRKSGKVQENKRLDMKKPVYESLEGYKEKNNKFLTEAVFEKFGFSLKNLLNEAKPRAPKGPAIPKPPAVAPAMPGAPAQDDYDFGVSSKGNYTDNNLNILVKRETNHDLSQIVQDIKKSGNERNLKFLKVIWPNFKKLVYALQQHITNSMSSQISGVPKSARSGQYPGARANVTYKDELITTLRVNAGSDKLPEIFVQTVYAQAGQLVMHFLDTFARTNVNNLKQRKQPWGEKSLRLWEEYLKPVMEESLFMIEDILDNFPEVETVRLTVNPEIASTIWDVEKGTQIQAGDALLTLDNKIREIFEKARQQMQSGTPTEEPPQTPGEAPASEPPPPPPPESAPVADKPESVATTASKPPRRIVNKMETPDQANPRAKSPGKPGKKKKKEEGEDPDRLPDKEFMPKAKFSGLDESKISLSTPNDVRKNTINVITLLEKLTNKGK